jgi:hypothetical protein
MLYMKKPSIPELEDAPELAVMTLLDFTLEILDGTLCASDRNLFEDQDFQNPNANSAVTHLAKAIIDHSEALRQTIAAYQKSIKAAKKLC